MQPDASASGSQGHASGDAARGDERPIGQRFRVAAVVNHVQGGGTLTITPGSIVFETDRPTRAFSRIARIVHTDPNVVVVTARLVPPWFNISLALDGEGGSARAITSVFARRRLSEALAAAGFNVSEARTQFSRDVNRDGLNSPLPGSVGGPWWTRRRTRASIAAASVAVGALMILLVSHSSVFVAIIAAGVLLNFATLFWRY